MKARDRVKGWPHPRSTTRAVGFYGDRRLFDILQWEAQEAADEQRRAYGSAESRLVFLAQQNGLRLAGAKESHRFYVVEEIWGRAGLYQEYIDGSNVHETYALTKNRKKEVTIVVKSSGESLQGVAPDYEGRPGDIESADESGEDGIQKPDRADARPAKGNLLFMPVPAKAGRSNVRAL